MLGANLLDQLLKLIDAVHLSDDDWTRVLRVMPNKLLKNHPFRPRSPLHAHLSGVDRQGKICPHTDNKLECMRVSVVACF